MNSTNTKGAANSNDANNPVYVSIVIPLFNEEESLPILLEKIVDTGSRFDFSYEIILVDDGSTDKTWEIIEENARLLENLKGIKFRRNYGQTSAMVAGFDYASGEIIVTLDGDLQNDPSDITRLLRKIEEGYDVVSGWRKNRKDHFSRVIPSKIANAIISLTTKLYLHDFGCSLKAYRSECIKSLKAYGEMHRFFPALAKMTGARITELEVKHHPRVYGNSKYGFDRVLKVLSDVLSMSLIIRFSPYPLKGFVLCAAPFVLLAMFFGLFGIIAGVSDWTTGKSLFFIIASILNGMAAFHLIMLGVLAELVVDTSDLTHTELPAISKKRISIDDAEANYKLINLVGNKK